MRNLLYILFIGLIINTPFVSSAYNTKLYIGQSVGKSTDTCVVNDEDHLLHDCHSIKLPFSKTGLVVAPHQNYAYVRGLFSTQIYACSLNQDATLSNCKPTATQIDNPQGLSFDSSGKYAYIGSLSLTNTGLPMCQVGKDGMLTNCRTVGSAFSQPNDIAINMQNTYLYATNGSDNNPTVCQIGKDGALNNCKPAYNNYSNHRDRMIAINPTGTYAYVSTSSLNEVDVFSINKNGTLSNRKRTGSGFSNPGKIVISPAGSVAFIQNNSNLRKCIINPQDGTLSACVKDPHFNGVRTLSVGSCPLYKAGIKYKFNDCVTNLTKNITKTYYCKKANSSDLCSQEAYEPGKSPQWKTAWSLQPTPALSSQYIVTAITIKTQTTPSGASYRIYANGFHEAPLYIDLHSANKIPADLLMKDLVIYNKNTGLPIGNDPADSLKVSYTNNGFDASIPSNPTASQLSSNSSESKIVSYLTALKTYTQVGVCAAIYNSDGTRMDTCGDGIDAPAYIMSITSPGFTLTFNGTTCLFNDPGVAASISGYADYSKITPSQSLGPITGDAGKYYRYFTTSLVGEHITLGHVTVTPRENMNVNDYSRLYKMNGDELNFGGVGYEVLQYHDHGTSTGNRVGNFSAFYVATGDIIKSVTHFPNNSIIQHETIKNNLTGPAIYVFTNSGRSEDLSSWGNIDFHPLSISATDIYGDKASINITNHGEEFVMSCP